MKNMFRKLNFKRGASLSIALLIFLLCVLAGVTALTMSMSNIGRYSHAQEDQQPYYTVSSAVLLLVDLLDGTTYESPTVQYDTIREWNYANPDGQVGKQPSSHPSREYNNLNILDMTKLYTSGNTGKNYLKSDWNTGDNVSTIAVYHTVKDEKGKEKEEINTSNPLVSGSTLKLLDELKGYCDKLIPYLVVPQEWYSSVKFKDSVGNDHDPEIKVEHFRPEASETLNYAFTVKAGDDSPVSARLVMEDNFNLILSFTYRRTYEGTGEVGFYAANVYWTATVEETTHSGQSDFNYTESGKSGSMTSMQTKKVTVRWDKENVTISRGEAYDNTTETNP